MTARSKQSTDHDGLSAPTAAVLFALLSLFPARLVAAPTLDFLPNLIGFGVGVTPRYAGAKESIVGVVPGMRYQFQDSQRFLELAGPLADMNLIDSPSWQLGPALGLRFGREDVKDEVVGRLPEVDMTVEGGLMASYAFLNTHGIPWRLRLGVTVLTDLGDVYHGANTTTFANFWVPLSRTVFLGLGGGVSFGSASYNNAYFGVTPAGATASGLPQFTPGSGMRQWYAWPAVVVQLDSHWYAGATVFYQRVSGEVGDSPIISQRGSQDQWTAGVGLGYVWK